MSPQGISGMPDPENPISKVEGPSDGAAGADISGLMKIKVGTLGQLKAALIQYLGEKEGMKFYNQFLRTFAMTMLQQVQQSASQAKKAAQGMRMDSQG